MHVCVCMHTSVYTYVCLHACVCVCVCGVHEYMFVCLFMYTLESSSLRNLPWCVHVFHISAIDSRKTRLHDCELGIK